MRSIGISFTTMGTQRNGFNKESFVLAVDVGTTSIRCHVYDKEAQIRGSCTDKVFIIFSLCFWAKMTSAILITNVHKHYGLFRG